MRYALLGPLEVSANGERIALGGPKQRLVLAHLLIRANELVSADLLIDEIWGDEPPDAARASLHSYISHLKKALGAERLISRPPGYVLRVAPDELDASRFETLVEQARRRLSADPAGAARALRDALELWQGEPFADLAAELSLAPEIERLSELRLAAIEDRNEAELTLGRHAELVPELDRLVARHPLRERLAGQLMLALYRAGRQAEALAAYHRLRTTLDDDLGLQPSPAIEQLQAQILNQDSALGLAGKRLRGYRLVEQIGTGPIGTVHLAFEPHTEREVAVKVLSAAVANDADFVRRFEADARRVARLEHPHIVPLLDWWREPDAAYLVSHLLRGGSLADRLAAAPLESAVTLGWAEQLASALDAAHRQGVIHGDLRPANVLLDAEGNAYLGDFAVGYDPAALGRGNRRKTDLGYLAPERKDGTKPSVETDLHAFAVIIEQLFGRASGGAAPGPPSDATRSAAAVLATVRPAGEGRPAPQPHGPPAARSPYKGLRPFSETDAADFFGREQLVDEIVGRLGRSSSRLVAVVGPSGSGKSSILSAGVIPAVRRAERGSSSWLVASMTPGDDPFEGLEEALRGVSVEVSITAQELADAEAGLGPLVARILPRHSRLLLVIDQFEELFTLSDDGRLHDGFLRTLARSTDDESAPLAVLIALRADFYDRPLAHDSFGRLLADGTLAVPPLTTADLGQAIAQPATQAGLELEPGLVARIVAEMSRQPGALPLLQYALTELWERREGRVLSLREYEASGGLTAAVGRRAEELYQALGRHGRAAARQLFLRLIELGEGTPDTARRVPLAELQSLQADRQLMDAAIEGFVRYRLLQLDRDASSRAPVVELAHEALLHAWPRLRRWVDDARDDLRQQRRLTAAAMQWLEAGRDPSFLLAGARLSQAEQWAAQSEVLLAPVEQEYLAASLAEADRLRAAEDERLRHEAELERRALGRLRLLVVTLGLGALLAGSLSVVAFNEGQRASREARVATARELAAAAVANLEVDPERSVLLAIEAIHATREADGTALREAHEALHRAVVASRVVLTIPNEGGRLDWATTHDGRHLIATEGPEESGVVTIYDGMSGATVVRIEAHRVDVNDVKFSPDGTLLATAGDDGALRIWDTTDGALVREAVAEGGAHVWGPSFSHDSRLAAAVWIVGDVGVVRMLDMSSGSLVDLPSGEWPETTAFSPDATRLAIGTQPGVLVVDIATRTQLYVAEGHSRSVLDVDWSADGRWIASGSADSTARIWDAETGVARLTLYGHSGEIHSIDWAADSSRLVTGSLDGTARVWEVTEDGNPQLHALRSHDLRGGVHGAAISADGRFVVAGDAGGVNAAKVWDMGLTGDAEWLNLPAVFDGPNALAYLSDGRLAATINHGTLTVWDEEGVEQLAEPVRHDDLVISMTSTSDDALIASAGFDGVKVWETASGATVAHPIDQFVVGIDWSPDGNVLAVGRWDEPSVTLYARDGSELGHLEEEADLGVRAVALSADGLLAASMAPRARFDPASQRVTIWDWRSGERTRSMPAPSGPLQFDPAGETLALGGYDGIIRLWRARSGEEIASWSAHPVAINDLDFSPDGQRLASSGDDGMVIVWDVTARITEQVLSGHTSPVSAARFNADGSRLASISADGTLRVWALDLDDLLDIAARKVTRTLTDDECRQYLHLEHCPAD